MGINKKAFFFTTIAIALSIVLLVSYNVYTFYGKKDEMKVVETRVVTMNSFIKDLEKDINNAIYIVGFRSLLSLEDYMMKYDRFFNDLTPPPTPSLNSAFEEVFKEGTINSEKMSLMENNTFLNWTRKMIEQANKTDIKLEFTIDDVTIDQTSHWLVVISVDLTVIVKDKKSTATWTIDKVYTNKINISGDVFVDPLYLVNNDGLVNTTIRKTPISDFGTELPTHLGNSYYMEHNDAPRYLMRFENNLGSSSCCGIESLVNSQKRIDKGLPALDRSAVDYIYFGTVVTTNCNIQGTPPYALWFKLDSGHLAFYEAACV